MPFKMAALLEPLGIGLHAVNLIQPKNTESAVIFGRGTDRALPHENLAENRHEGNLFGGYTALPREICGEDGGDRSIRLSRCGG